MVFTYLTVSYEVVFVPTSVQSTSGPYFPQATYLKLDTERAPGDEGLLIPLYGSRG